MLTSHILKFCNPYHGGAHGGAPFIEPRSRIQFQKSHFFCYKILCRSYERPSSAPPCTPKIAPPFASSFLRPSTRPSLIAPPVAAVKMWFFTKLGFITQLHGPSEGLRPAMRPSMFHSCKVHDESSNFSYYHFL